MATPFTYERATLERIEIAVQDALDPLLLQPSATMDVEDFVKKRFVMLVRGFLWSEQAGVAEVVYPADWWQAFKERWLPKRWLRRWPVRCCVVRLKAQVIYRDFRPSIQTNDWYLNIVKQSLPERRTASFVCADPDAPIEVEERRTT